MESPSIVGFIGLDELSLELASSLIRSGYKVQAFEVFGPLMDKFLKLGGAKCASPGEAVRDAAASVLLMCTSDQMVNIFLEKEGALTGLQKDAIIILRSTISLAYMQKLEKNLTENGKVTYLVDAHVSKGTSEAFQGKLMITSSGRSEAIAKARPVLSAMCEKLYVLEGEVGAGSKIKMVIELLEGIHLVASMEAIFLGIQAGIHPWILYNIISNAAGNSW